MKTLQSNLTQEYLKECFEYDHQTGVLYWKERPRHHFNKSSDHKRWNTRYAGNRAGTISTLSSGYQRITVRVDSTRYLATRIIWLLVHGTWPQYVLDHINGDSLDNRIDNLRDIPQEKNCHNRKLSSNNKSGYNGIHFKTSQKKWMVTGGLMINGSTYQIYLGYYTDLQDAISMRQLYDEVLGYTIRQ